MSSGDREADPDPKRVAEDIEKAAERLRATIAPQRGEDGDPEPEPPRRGFFARLFGRIS